MGMLLEIDNFELLYMLEFFEFFCFKVDEVVVVLQVYYVKKEVVQKVGVVVVVIFQIRKNCMCGFFYFCFYEYCFCGLI